MRAASEASGQKAQRRTQAERREEAERLILDAATRLIAEKGLDAFTLADAGEAAGYSRSLPVHYFGSKAELLSAVVRHIRDWFFSGVEPREKGRPGLGRLIASIDSYFDVCRTDRTMLHALHVVLAGALYKPALAEAIATLNRESSASIEHAIRAGIADGEIHRDIDPRTWSVLILSSGRGIVAQWLADPENVDLAMLHSNFVASLKRNFAPRESAWP